MMKDAMWDGLASNYLADYWVEGDGSAAIAVKNPGIEENFADCAKMGEDSFARELEAARTSLEQGDLANKTEFGLLARIFTRDLVRSHRVARKLRPGQVFVNEWLAGRISTPFSRAGKSDFDREKGLKAFYNDVRTKNIAFSLKY